MFRSYLSTKLIALATLGSGLVNIYSVIGRELPGRMKLVLALFPLEFIHVSKILALLIGFGLVVSAINIYKRKRRALYAVLILSILSVVFHLTKGLDYEEASVSFVLAVVLLLTRGKFTVRSSTPDFRTAVLRLLVSVGVAFAYGAAGFWMLDRRDFGIDFHLADAVRETFRYLAFVEGPELIPRTRYARWFLDSLHIITATAIVYSIYSLFRPVLYKFVTYPHERAAARAIVEEHGRSALDYFKFWPDKSFLFSSSRRSFIAYGVGSGFALALADPVGPEDEIEGLLEEFSEFCRGNDWGCGFHQTLPDFLPLYEKLGYRKLKVGDDAIVNLAAFSLDGRERKTLRHTINKLEENGITYHWHDPPIDDGVISQAAAVSDEWLRIPGRRERRFTLGMFDPGYLRSTPIAAARDGGGTMLAFVNQIPSYRKGEATVDLMRHRTNVPAGIMDYLFVKLFLQLKGRGFERFNLGMSPMSGFQEYEKPSAEEKAIHYLFQHLNFLFSYRGLKHYKAKYAGTWEPRYAIYRNPLDLARLAVALRYVTEMKAVGTNDLDSFAREGIDLEAGAPPDHSG